MEGLWLFAKNVLFAVFVPGLLGYWAPWRWVAGVSPRDVRWGPWELASLVPVALGTAGLLWSIWHFAVTGRGTPAPFDPPRRLVVKGLYRVVRNPMYVSVLTVVLGWAILLRSPAIAGYAAAGWLLFNGFVFGVEEPSLRAKFGADYAAYCAAVRRWIPGRPWSPPAGLHQGPQATTAARPV